MNNFKKNVNDLLNLNNNLFPKLVFSDLIDEKDISYIKILHDEVDVKGLIYCDTLDDLISQRNNEFLSSINFIEVKFENYKWFRFVEIDENGNFLLRRDYHKFPNKWEIFFNSSQNIVLHDPLFPEKSGHFYLRDNYLYPKINFYIGISSLILKVKNTEKISFLELKEEIEKDYLSVLERFLVK